MWYEGGTESYSVKIIWEPHNLVLHDHVCAAVLQITLMVTQPVEGNRDRQWLWKWQICVKVALNLHTYKRDSLLIIMFSVITRSQYIKKQCFVHVPSTAPSIFIVHTVHLSLSYSKMPQPAWWQGALQTLTCSKNKSAYSEHLVPKINQIII